MSIQFSLPKAHKPLLLGIVIAISAIAANTSLAGAGELPSVKVKYADLDLTTDVGVHRLYKRISAAAELVCPTAGRDLMSLSVSRRCKTETIERTVLSLGNPKLAAIHAEHTHQG